MAKSDSTRIGLVSALALAILFIAAGVVVPEIPGTDANPGEVAAYFADHRDGLVVSGFLIVASTVPFLIFLSVLRHRLGEATYWLADTAYGAGLMLFGLTTLYTIILL